MRVLATLVIGFIVIVLLAAGAGILFLDKLVIYGVKVGGKKGLGLETSVKDAKVSLTKGSIELYGLTVKDPKEKERILFIRKLSGKAEVSAFTKDPLRISEVKILGPEFTYIPGWRLKLPESGKGERAKTKSEKKSAKKVIVNLLEVKDGKVLVTAAGKKLTIPMPNITLKELGGKDGMEAKKMAQEVLNSISSTATTAAGQAGTYLKKAGESVKEKVKTLKDRFFK